MRSGMRRGVLTVAALLAAAACASNPMPGDREYPYNLAGVYDASFEVMGVVYAGPAELQTSPGGMVYGTMTLTGEETVTGRLEGTVSGDTLIFEWPYDRSGGCTGMTSGAGVIDGGGGAVSGTALVEDDCLGEMFEGPFVMNRRTE